MARNPNESLDIINISDSESEPGDRPFLPQASLASSDVVSSHWQPTFSRCESPDILVIDSTDSEDLDELEAKLKDAHLGNKPNVCSHPYITESIGHTRPARRIESQADILVLSSSEEDTVNVNLITRHHISSGSNSLKEAPVRSRKQKDRVAGTNPNVLKAQANEHAKEQAKSQRNLNKLVTDRKDTLKDFTVELSRAFQDHLFVDHLERKLSVHDCSISFFDPPPQSESLIRFRRQHIARYDSRLKEWVPTTPHAALEDLYVLFLSADTLALALLQEDITEMLASLRRTHCLTTHSQIFIMIDGLNGYYKRKKGRKDERNTIESALTSLQALERCFIVHVEGAEDTAQWLFNITGDLGIRPHRRIQESFLPFCTDTQVKCGSSKADTYKKMLQQIRNVTESAADGIIQEAPTLRELFEGYAREPDMHNRHDRLKRVVVSETISPQCFLLITRSGFE
ncbi:ERCC4 domain protein [Rhizoctonia solani 123E]|uniref:ERCC4 domain protein n=1 Tax=Rhizoctonia solani 123E TaxID=1423351 RepID=A0A074S7L2_9AGAM|nr:ERCC4 domain protein [Rhizoctonia solani 123E]